VLAKTAALLNRFFSSLLWFSLRPRFTLERSLQLFAIAGLNLDVFGLVRHATPCENLFKRLHRREKTFERRIVLLALSAGVSLLEIS
jgi:hypothetical protein